MTEDASERTIRVRQEDNGYRSLAKGEYGEFIHRDDEPCENAPESGYLRFAVRDGNGSADLCPDWVRSLRQDLVTDGGVPEQIDYYDCEDCILSELDRWEKEAHEELTDHDLVARYV